MRSLQASSLCVAVSFAAISCGPGVATLAREKRYNELSCAPSNEEDVVIAAKALVEGVAPRYRLIEITRADVEKPTPELDAVLAKKAFFGVVPETQKIDFATELWLRVMSASGDDLPAARPELIAAAVGEKLPPGKSSTSSSVSIDTDEATRAILTLGISRLFSNKPAVSVGTTTTVEGPTDAEIEREAPMTFEILLAVMKKAQERKYRWFVADRGAPVKIGYELKLFRHGEPCVFMISHGGDPITFGRPETPFSWDGWTLLDFTHNDDVIKASHGK